MNPTEDEATDIRTRDLAARQRDIMDGAKVWGQWPGLEELVESDRYRQAHLIPPIPRRTDWYRVVALTIVILAACAAGVAFAFALAFALGAF